MITPFPVENAISLGDTQIASKKSLQFKRCSPWRTRRPRRSIENAPPIEARETPSFPYFSTEERIVLTEILNLDPDAGWIGPLPYFTTKYEFISSLIDSFPVNDSHLKLISIASGIHCQTRVRFAVMTRCSGLIGIPSLAGVIARAVKRTIRLDPTWPTNSIESYPTQLSVTIRVFWVIIQISKIFGSGAGCVHTSGERRCLQAKQRRLLRHSEASQKRA